MCVCPELVCVSVCVRREECVDPNILPNPNNQVRVGLPLLSKKIKLTVRPAVTSHSPVISQILWFQAPAMAFLPDGTGEARYFQANLFASHQSGGGDNKCLIFFVFCVCCLPLGPWLINSLRWALCSLLSWKHYIFYFWNPGRKPSCPLCVCLNAYLNSRIHAWMFDCCLTIWMSERIPEYTVCMFCLSESICANKLLILLCFKF